MPRHDALTGAGVNRRHRERYRYLYAKSTE
jgi:hypothetical protein